MNKKALTITIFLFAPALSIAHDIQSEYELKSAKVKCEQAENGVDLYRKIMRKGYSSAQREQYEGALREHKEDRSHYCNHKVKY